MNPTGGHRIGTTTPTSPLEVRGEIKSTDSAGNNRLWGQGRPGTIRYGTTGIGTGLCTNSGISFGLSSVMVDWSGAQAACPSGTWVCTAAERGSAVCNTARPDGTSDSLNTDGSSNNDAANNHLGWVADASSAYPLDSGYVIREQGTAYNWMAQGALAVWCCSQ
ncbi:MAG: hypothetical protein IPM97_10995 [Bdellovibrionaceae bacterium]|nr:hypothetical protein [Pseudobdellovibrionaceae bacterium]